MRMPLNEIDELLTSAGQPFEIENLEVSGIPLRNWKHTPSSLAEIVEASRQFGARDFIVYQDERLSFEQHYRWVAAVACYSSFSRVAALPCSRAIDTLVQSLEVSTPLCRILHMDEAIPAHKP